MNNKEDGMQAILSYNPRNLLAQRTLDYILSLGVFRLEKPNAKTKTNTGRLANDFEAAMQEVKDADNFNERALEETIRDF